MTEICASAATTLTIAASRAVRTRSRPAVTLPNGVYRGGSGESWYTMKNWLPLVFGPALAIATVPAG